MRCAGMDAGVGQVRGHQPQCPLLAGHVAVISGGAGAIGAATAQAFFDEGAAIVLLDLNIGLAEEIASSIGGLSIACDITDAASVNATFDTICKTYGGVDILVSGTTIFKSNKGNIKKNIEILKKN